MGGIVNMFIVDYYKTVDGHCPVMEFFESLNEKLEAKTLRTVELLEKEGNELGMPFSKHLEDGIFELRTQLGSDITRVLYFFMKDKTIILTHGFVKKTQKTPPEQIKRAKEYREDYLSREEDDHE